MDISKLQKIISGGLVGTDFSVSDSAFGQAPTSISTLFNDLFQQGTFSLSSAKAVINTDPILVEGTLSSGLVDAFSYPAGFEAKASFTVDKSGNAQLSLSLSPPADKIAHWGLPDMDEGYKNSLFSAFGWSDARIEFDTSEPAQMPKGFPENYGYSKLPSTFIPAAKSGATFNGTASYQGSDVGLNWLLGSQPIALSGTIDWLGDVTQMDIASPPLKSLTVGDYTLPATFHCVSIPLASIKADLKTPTVQPLPMGALCGTLGLPTGSQALEIPFVIEMINEPLNQVRVIGDFTQASKLGLQDVAKLLAVPNLDHAQSTDFPTLEGLALTKIDLAINTLKDQLQSASVEVVYTPPGGVWEPFGSDLLSFQEMDITFSVIGPLTTPTFETSVKCIVGLAGGTLDAAISLPNLQFSCDLEDGVNHPIDLTNIIDDITDGAFSKLTPNFKLLCTELNVLGDKTAGNYQFRATIADNWVFSAGGANFALESIGFDITRQVSGTPTTTGQVVASFMIANVEAQISADYEGGDTGWKFSGGTLPNQNIPLTELVGDALHQFGLQLPAAVPSVNISDLSMMLTTGTLDFGFSCEGTLQIAGQLMTIGIDLGRTHDDPEKPADVTTTFKGYLEVSDQYFEVDFATGPTDKSISFQWHDDGKPLGFVDIAKAFGFDDVPDIPSSLELDLTEASFTYDFTSKILILTAVSKNYGAAVFIGDGSDQTTKFYGFGINLDLGITLADIPLVGNKIPDADQLGIPTAGIWILSNALPKAEVKKVNEWIGSIQTTGLPTLPDEDLTARVLMQAVLQLGTGKGMPLSVSLGSSAPTPATPASSNVALAAVAAPSPPPPAGDTSTKWISIQRQFGIFQFNRIGIRYEDNTLFFVFDACMTMGPMSLSMDGLAIGSPLTKFEPKFDISGLGLGYNQPPLEIEGALLKVPTEQLAPNTEFQFDGLAVVKASEFSLSAVGSYAQMTSGDPSLFVFAQLEAPLGDPTGTGAMFITGLMGGFGFNRNLAIPEQNEVQGFPLLQLAQPPAPGTNAQTQDPMFVLDVLEGRKPAKTGGVPKAWIEPSPGEYWLGAGLEFTSWELVNTKALLIIEFGHDLVFALLGLSTMQLPQASESDETYAFVELQLRAVFKPTDGVFALSAVLSDTSYVITPDCHLTGGFAFDLWFGDNDNSGQFVITLGGYHPAFKPPDYFPTEPRLGFNWAVSSTVSIKGSAYFALTPSCIMAGGGLEVLFHDGDLRAWFTAQADFLVSWRPFFFIADMSLSIGVSYRLNLLVCHKTISVSIGAQLKLWGPPTGGAVTVHLVVVSFTVHFGSKSAAANTTALKWVEFQQLLPHPDNICRITPQSGLHKTEKSDDPSGKLWIVRARDFRFSTQSSIPSSALAYGTGPAPVSEQAAIPATVNIRPMNHSDVTSTHQLSIFQGMSSTTPHDITGWTLTPRSANIPDSLWGLPSAPFKQIPDKPTANVLPGQITGYDVTAPPPAIGTSLGLVSLSALAEEYLSPAGQAPLCAAVAPTTSFVPSADSTSIAKIANLMQAPALKARNELFQVLSAADIYSGSNGPVDEIVQQANHLFSAAPMVQTPT